MPENTPEVVYVCLHTLYLGSETNIIICGAVKDEEVAKQYCKGDPRRSYTKIVVGQLGVPEN